WGARLAPRPAASHWRGRKPESPIDESHVVGFQAPGAEAREALEAIRALPDAYREPLLMRLVEGMSGAEIAERTGLTPGSVRVNLHRGMQLLRERLGGARTHGFEHVCLSRRQG